MVKLLASVAPFGAEQLEAARLEGKKVSLRVLSMPADKRLSRPSPA